MVLLTTKMLTGVVSLVTAIALFLIIPLILVHVRYVGELEEAMRRKIIELDEARGVAEQANARKGEFMVSENTRAADFCASVVIKIMAADSAEANWMFSFTLFSQPTFFCSLIVQAFLCHEIRNPLHVITANIDFLLESSNMSGSLSTSADGDCSVDRDRDGMHLERECTAHSSDSVGGSVMPQSLYIISTETPAGHSDASGSTASFAMSSSSPHGGGSRTTSAPAVGNILFNIPSMPSSATHSRGASLAFDATQLAGIQNVALQTDPLLTSNFHHASETDAIRSLDKTSRQTPNTAPAAGKRRTWPSVESIRAARGRLAAPL
jgi:hypothetical protein